MMTRRHWVLVAVLAHVAAAPVLVTACVVNNTPGGAGGGPAISPTDNGGVAPPVTTAAGGAGGSPSASSSATASATASASATATATSSGTASATASGSASTTSACAGAPPKPGYVCAQSCGPPVARQNDPPPPMVWMDPAKVKDGHAFPCPRCLPGDARIATPSGDVLVRDLRPGTMVYTRDEHGLRVAAPVLRVGSTEVPPSHALVKATLADGRVVRGSAEHPTSDGRTLGALHAGDTLDGARVVSVDRLPYPGARTYDLLPAGATGAYWSDGVLIGTTLK